MKLHNAFLPAALPLSMMDYWMSKWFIGKCKVKKIKRPYSIMHRQSEIHKSTSMNVYADCWCFVISYTTYYIHVHIKWNWQPINLFDHCRWKPNEISVLKNYVAKVKPLKINNDAMHNNLQVRVQFLCCMDVESSFYAWWIKSLLLWYYLCL